jgi:predicted dehydrogenase
MSNAAQPSRRDFLKTVAGAGAGIALAQVAARGAEPAPAGDAGMTLFAAPKMETVRVGFIGVGARGGGHLGTMLSLEGVQVTAIADNHAPSLANAVARVEKAGRPKPAAFGNGDMDYLHLLERDDVDIVIIATPWELHTPMCVAAMKAGKHAFTEVPAAVTTEECWELVDTSEKTRKLCMMMENVNYGREELFLLNICRLGLLGDLLHGEAAYIHELRGQMNQADHGTGSWRTWHYAKRNGNLYPTHGLGPVAHYMNINRGDRFDYLSSVSSPALGRKLFAEKTYPPAHKWNQIKDWKCGDMNTSIIKTALGRTLMVQWDETSPRPYSRHNLIQGTRGTFAGFPNRLAAEGITPATHDWTEGAGLEAIMAKYEHPLWKRMGEEAKKGGGHGGMDWLMLWRLVYCLRNGEPLDQSVYDAAAWSVVGPLSADSIARRSTSVDVPDFTRGRWKTTPPLPIVS